MAYKQQDGIRYHARDFALVRAKARGIPVLLGSATPSLETLHNAYAGRYTHLRLKQRAGDARPPRVRILDVRKRPLHDGLSADVLAGIGEHLQRGQQVLVFKNRRGYAPVLLCHDCGWTAPCNRCDAPMTVHGAGTVGMPGLRQPGAATAGYRHRTPGRTSHCGLRRFPGGAHRPWHHLAPRCVGTAAGEAGRPARHPGRHADPGQGPRPAQADPGGGGGHR
ncbi:hypothetical protein G6F40_013348 [Rhizopus arrhizus]|nr:hypothetical protein G6F40_013348 [Rhizopus arrhizus]